MYTRCPQCRTVFTLTSEQLAARGGLVRCGRCAAVFRGDHYLHKHLVPQPTTQADATPAVLDDLGPDNATELVADSRIPTITTLSVAARPRRLRAWIFGFGSVVLFLLLMAQYVYAYRPQWLQHSQIQPWVERFCEVAPCPVHSMQDPEKIELLETEVLPHPKYDEVLRVSGLLINRANFIQPFPLLEIAFTNNRGQVVARRTFQPRQYLEPPVAAGGMPPQRSVKILLDLTSPGRDAVGYEIRLVISPS